MVLIGPWTARQCGLAIGYIYPIYKSSRALRRGDDQHKLLHWITFWTVNALFWMFEMVGDTVIGWMPLYYEAKIVFLVWLVMPSYRGAHVLHSKWLAPKFEQHEEVIDVALMNMKRRASEKMVQVCKETAVLALRRGSGVVVQSQQFVAAQLVQQALGNLQTSTSPAETQEVRMPAVLSLLSAAVPLVTSVATTPTPSKPAPESFKSEPKESDPVRMPSTTTIRNESKNDDPPQAPSKKLDDPDADAKPTYSKETSPKKHIPTPPTTTPAPSSSTRQDKSKELVAHFKKLLVKGFRLTYHPPSSDDGRRRTKQRTLRLAHAQSRYLIFESASSTSTTTTTTDKKSVQLFLHNVRRVVAGLDGEVDDTKIDPSLALVLDNGKTTLLFEADNQKTRDLLVAGMRLLLNEHRRNDTAAITILVALHDRQTKQHAFDRLLYAVHH